MSLGIALGEGGPQGPGLTDELLSLSVNVRDLKERRGFGLAEGTEPATASASTCTRRGRVS